MSTKAPTIRDVAELAGVSAQTVSCVINGKGSISAATRLRVMQAIETLNYRRNPIARSMRTRQTGLIGLLVLDITSPVLSTIASTIEAAAYAEEYNVLLYNVGHSVRRERDFVEKAADRRVDGLIIVNAVDETHSIEMVAQGSIPTVLVASVETTAVPSVSTDNVRGAYLATQHAIELGHRKIAHISGALELAVARHRVQGYQQALANYGLSYRQVVTPPGNRWSYRDGYEAMRRLLQTSPRPTAVFVAGDQMAIGAYRALTEAGLSVPDDMSVIGFDDIEAAMFTAPPLTTIRQPFYEIATQAFSLLLQIMDGQRPQGAQIILPPELVVRESTRSVR